MMAKSKTKNNKKKMTSTWNRMAVAWVMAKEARRMSAMKLNMRSSSKDSRIIRRSRKSRSKNRMIRRMKKRKMTTTSIWKMISMVKWKTWKLQRTIMKRIRSLTRRMMS